jgi:hypothetical protein
MVARGLRSVFRSARPASKGSHPSTASETKVQQAQIGALGPAQNPGNSKPVLFVARAISRLEIMQNQQIASVLQRLATESGMPGN